MFYQITMLFILRLFLKESPQYKLELYEVWKSEEGSNERCCLLELDPYSGPN